MVRKTSQQTCSEIAMDEAVQKVKSKALTLRQAAAHFAHRLKNLYSL